jgi:hypothetical protein
MTQNILKNSNLYFHFEKNPKAKKKTNINKDN